MFRTCLVIMALLYCSSSYTFKKYSSTNTLNNRDLVIQPSRQLIRKYVFTASRGKKSWEYQFLSSHLRGGDSDEDMDDEDDEDKEDDDEVRIIMFDYKRILMSHRSRLSMFSSDFSCTVSVVLQSITMNHLAKEACSSCSAWAGHCQKS